MFEIAWNLYHSNLLYPGMTKAKYEEALYISSTKEILLMIAT